QVLSSFAHDKAALRQLIRSRIAGLSLAQRQDAAAAVGRRLEELPAWHGARTVLLYAPLAGELDIWPMILVALRSNKSVALPAFDPPSGNYIARQIQDLDSEIVPGKFGAREPLSELPVL